MIIMLKNGNYYCTKNYKPSHLIVFVFWLKFFFNLDFFITSGLEFRIEFTGGDQHLERPNVERPIFWNFKISSIEITKVQLFDFSILEFVFFIFTCV